MIRTAMLAASAFALSLTANAASAQTFKGGEVPAEEVANFEFSIDGKYLEGVYIAEAVLVDNASLSFAAPELGTEPQMGQASPVRLVEWDGDFELMKQSVRLRIWRSHLAYRLTVDPQGEVTDCELTESFRRLHITMTLCEVLSDHHTFEPALDENGQAIEGSYTDRISYQELRARL